MTDFKYIVIYVKNGEIGWSSSSEHFQRFNNYKEAVEFYDTLEVSEKNYDYGIQYKKIYRIVNVKVRPS